MGLRLGGDGVDTIEYVAHRVAGTYTRQLVHFSGQCKRVFVRQGVHLRGVQGVLMGCARRGAQGVFCVKTVHVKMTGGRV